MKRKRKVSAFARGKKAGIAACIRVANSHANAHRSLRFDFPSDANKSAVLVAGAIAEELTRIL